ncbi:MAG: SPFH domain / Band 7 family protein [Parcubacteria bacterium OLB19]|nr:MAG: SPFH domain / Band 7 family protein [Parcubacteria bacterium OLB19]
MWFTIILTILVLAIIGFAYVFYKDTKNFAKQIEEGNRVEDLKKPSSFYILISTAVTILVIMYNSFIMVPVGTIYVASLFNTMQTRSYTEGFHTVNPFLDFSKMSARKTAIHFGGGDASEGDGGMISQSKNNLPLIVEATFSFVINPVYAYWVFQRMGNDESYINSLIIPVTRSAVRSSVSQYTSEEATTSKREELAVTMEEKFLEHLVSDLVSQGMEKSDAQKVFTILPVQIRKVLPPQKVLNAIAEKAAADEDLAKQKTLTFVAEEEANRRGNEGKGITNLFSSLPTGFTPEQIALIINAISNNTKATAFLKGVENGSINTIVIDGSPTGVPISNNK